MLRKGVYPYEYMDDWEKLKETSLPEKEGFFNNLNMEDITDADYTHAKRVCKDIKIKTENTMTCMFKTIHYCQQMYSRTFEICFSKYMNLILLVSYCTRICMSSSLKNDQSKTRSIN